MIRSAGQGTTNRSRGSGLDLIIDLNSANGGPVVLKRGGNLTNVANLICHAHIFNHRIDVGVHPHSSGNEMMIYPKLM